MVRLGYMMDLHVKDDSSVTHPGSDDEFINDYDSLVNTHNVDDIYFLGDQVNAFEDFGQVPHVPKGAFDRFWDTLFGQVGDPDKLVAAIPGNHDVPIQHHVRSHEKAIIRPMRVDYDADDVSVFLINSQVPGLITGSPAPAGNNGAIGAARPRFAYSHIKWLDQELSSLSTSRTKIIMSHATPIAFGQAWHSSGQIAKNPDSNYRTPINHNFMREMLSQFSQVVCLWGHDYVTGTGNERSWSRDGIYGVSTQHYYDEQNDETLTYNYIDADGSGVTVTAENPRAGNTYTTEITF